MFLTKPFNLSLVFLFVLLVTPLCEAAGHEEVDKNTKQSTISFSEDMGDAMIKEAARVRKDLEMQARSLFERTPLGWDWQTIDYLYTRALTLPLKIPQFIEHIMEQSRVLGAAGSLIMLTFIIAVVYSLLGQKRVLTRIERLVQPLREKMPEAFYPFFLSTLKVVVASLIPLLLLGGFSLINAMIAYRAAWFLLTGRLLILWAVGALMIGLLREVLTGGLFEVTARYGSTIFRLSRLVLLYVLAGVAVFRGAEVFPIRDDVLALLKFAVSISIVLALFLLLLRKKALLSLLPQLPYRSYQGFIDLLNRFYYPSILLSFLFALLWCVGYKEFGEVVLIKTWSAAGAYLLIMVIHHVLRGWLQIWRAKADPHDEAAQFLSRSFKALLLYATFTAAAVIVLNLLGLMNPIRRVMSFPVLTLGVTPVTLWIIVKAVLILLAFVYATRLLRAFLDYKIYPYFGVDPGLGYALNTFLNYFFLAVGFLISLRIVGLDLRFLLVFAGAIGIGIGLGLQSMAANVISGFAIIFGGKIRKGDWIEVSNTVGAVTDISLRATQVRTRDNIEYIIPNSDFISSTVTNYSLSSPMIRIVLPVGVSYDSDPRQVEKILLEAAEKEPLVTKYQPPAVRFVEYADNSINFELLIWIDVRHTPRRRVRSELYFAIFDEFKKAGIEIPFPQRDIHIRSKGESTQLPLQPPVPSFGSGSKS
ncbi:MAG: mechanosensitive ion channel [Desulfobacterales bacterium]|nr:MAG: mechanosensitive ion channel [Desulfobacterales bacterium]